MENVHEPSIHNLRKAGMVQMNLAYRSIQENARDEDDSDIDEVLLYPYSSSYTQPEGSKTSREPSEHTIKC
jgi:hypothetical protein